MCVTRIYGLNLAQSSPGKTKSIIDPVNGMLQGTAGATPASLSFWTLQ